MESGDESPHSTQASPLYNNKEDHWGTRWDRVEMGQSRWHWGEGAD